MSKLFQSRRYLPALSLALLSGCAHDEPSPLEMSQQMGVAQGARSAAAIGGAAVGSDSGAAEQTRGGSPAGRGGMTSPRGRGAGGATSTTSGNTAFGGMRAGGVVSAGAGAGVGGITSMAAAAGASAGASGSAGGVPTEACQRGVVKASDVVFIGESFIAATGDIPRFTSELARKAGTIGASESYRSFAVSGTQLTTGDIPGQYTRAKAAAPVKVVLMDGGGNDLLLGGRCMDSVDAACREIMDVVDKLFAQFKTDGVTDVVYFFYPDPMGIGAGIKEAMDILRPEMKKLCDESAAVRCVWVDQRESWEGKYDTFTSDGIHPTQEGSKASAQQIWDAMVANCIAQ